MTKAILNWNGKVTTCCISDNTTLFVIFSEFATDPKIIVGVSSLEKYQSDVLVLSFPQKCTRLKKSLLQKSISPYHQPHVD